MKRLFAVAIIFTSDSVFGLYFRGDSPTALAGGGGGGAPACSSKNGDVNASGKVDLSDAVTILSFLFLGSPTKLVPLCASSAAASGLPDTGQRFCRDEAGNTSRRECFSGSCPGQDASNATGCPNEGRFTDNRDATVTDHCTGLMWQRDTTDVKVDEQIDGSDVLPWCNALTYCGNLSFAGHDDWRLPNVRELQSIVDYGSFGPSIDPKFTAFWTGGTGYWSSTFDANDPSFAWIVAFGDGSVSRVINSFTSYVRAVRNAP